MKLRFPLITLLLCFLVLSSLNSPFYIDQEVGVGNKTSQLVETPYVQSYENHGPIVIEGDDNLTAWGFPGSGSVGEPFRIEGYNFTLNGTAISVTDVSLHLLITGCWVQSAGDKTGNGIYFENVTSGRIENSTIMDKTYGIHIFESDSCTIFDIEITGTTTYGVFFDTSVDCEIDQSYIHHTSNMGIMDEGTRTIVSNTIIQHVSVNGMFSMGMNITVTGCEISYASQRGIRNEAWYSIFSNNEIYHNTWDGIYDRTARYNTFSNNRIFGNGWSGIWAYTSRYETYTGNTFFNNEVGFSQSSSFSGYSDFYSNSVGWNLIENAQHDAVDPNNYDDGMSVGNAWSDYEGTPPYIIGGLLGGADNYPTLLVDNVDPNIVSAQEDIVISDIEDYTLTWNFSSEEFPKSKTIQINGSGTSSRWDGREIEYSLNDLPIGIHNISLIVQDCAGNIATDTVIVEVYGFTIDNPADMVMEKGTVGNSIEWFARSGAQDIYEVYINGSLEFTGLWDSWEIEYITDNLLIGVNMVEIRVFNASGGYLSDFVLVYVEDTIDPVIGDLGRYYLEKDSLLTLEWTVEDLNPDRLTLLMNGSPILESVWNYPIFSIEIIGSEIGTWNYTLMIVDEGGRVAADTAIVVVRDSNPTATETTTPTTTRTTTIPINDTRIDELEGQVFTQAIIIAGVGALAILSLLLNIVIFRKVGKKGK